MPQDHKSGLPNKSQLMTMLKRYSTIEMSAVDTNQETITITSDTGAFRKPIFFNADCGKTLNKIKMALKQQAHYAPENNPDPSRIILNGDSDLVKAIMNDHRKLLGNDPYNPKKPYENYISLLEGENIPVNDIMPEQGAEKKESSE